MIIQAPSKNPQNQALFSSRIQAKYHNRSLSLEQEQSLLVQGVIEELIDGILDSERSG